MLSVIAALAQAPAHLGLHLPGEKDGGDRFYPYRELYLDIQRGVNLLAAQGVEAGTPVIFPFVTSYEAIVAFLALIARGAVPYSVKPAQVGGSRASYDEFIAQICRLYQVRAVMAWTGGTVDLAAVISMAGLAAQSPEAGAQVSNELAFVQFSSGSTAFPKGIPVSHAAALQNLAMINRHDGRGESSVMHSWLPLYHDMGLIGGLLSCLASRSPLWLRTPLWFLADPWRWLEELSRQRVFAIAIPDFALGYTLKAVQDVDAAELAALDLSGLRAAYLGSEPINPAHIAAFAAQLAPAGWRSEAFIPCYGMAEAVLMVSGVPMARPFRIKTLANGQSYVGLGPIFAEFKLRIVDDATRAVLGDGEIGEIELCGGSLAAGYLARNQPLTGPDGYYATGDLGFVEAGELFVTGRCGDRVKINGQSFFLPDFDQAAEAVEAEHRAKVVAYGVGGEVHVACELRGTRMAEAGAAIKEQLIAAFLHKLGVKLAPQAIHLVGRGTIPKTSSGKVQRSALERAVAACGA